MGLNRSPPFSPHLIYADSGNFQEGLGYYVLDNLSDKMLAAEYRTVLPDEKLIAQELDRSRRQLEKRASVKVRHP